MVAWSPRDNDENAHPIARLSKATIQVWGTVLQSLIVTGPNNQDVGVITTQVHAEVLCTAMQWAWRCLCQRIDLLVDHVTEFERVPQGRSIGPRMGDRACFSVDADWHVEHLTLTNLRRFMALSQWKGSVHRRLGVTPTIGPADAGCSRDEDGWF